MRAYIDINNIKSACSVDCITVQNKDTGEVLNLSFSETDCCVTNKGITLRQKNEEIATFGLPKSLEGVFGNNKETYDFIKNSTVESMTLCSMNGEPIKGISNAKLTGLRVEVGAVMYIEYEITELEHVSLEGV